MSKSEISGVLDSKGNKLFLNDSVSVIHSLPNTELGSYLRQEDLGRKGIIAKIKESGRGIYCVISIINDRDSDFYGPQHSFYVEHLYKNEFHLKIKNKI